MGCSPNQTNMPRCWRFPISAVPLHQTALMSVTGSFSTGEILAYYGVDAAYITPIAHHDHVKSDVQSQCCRLPLQTTPFMVSSTGELCVASPNMNRRCYPCANGQKYRYVNKIPVTNRAERRGQGAAGAAGRNGLFGSWSLLHWVLVARQVVRSHLRY